MIINASAGRQQVVNITVLALVPVVSAIIFEYWLWRESRQYFFTYFLAIFDTNTFVFRCTS